MEGAEYEYDTELRLQMGDKKRPGQLNQFGIPVPQQVPQQAQGDMFNRYQAGAGGLNMVYDPVHRFEGLRTDQKAPSGGE